MSEQCCFGLSHFICDVSDDEVAYCFCRFDTVYLDDDLRVVKDIRGDYLVVDRASYNWKE